MFLRSPEDTVGRHSPTKLKDKIIYYLAEQGYLSASVLIDTLTDSTTITYLVNTGPKYIINNWRFWGNEFFTEQQLSAAVYRRNRPFSKTELIRCQQRLINLYQRHGFPFVSVQLLEIDETVNKVTPIIKITEGPKVKISFLKFSGSRIPESLLRRYSGFRQPVDYDIARIHRWQRSLKNTGWIVIDSTDIILYDSSYGIRFWLTSQRSNEISAILAYSPEKPHLAGWARVSFLNLLNSGRILRAGWSSTYQETKYHLQYTEPWFFNLPLSLTGSISHTVSDTLYALSNLSFTGTVTPQWGQLNISSGWEYLIADKTTKTTFWAGTGFTFDNWDDILNPKNGILFTLTSKAGNQSIDTIKNKLIGAIELKIAPVFPLTNSIVLFTNLGVNAAYSSLPLTEPELYAVGGANHIRGYRENYYRTPRILYCNSELRYYFLNKSRIHLFYDLGFFADRSGDPAFLSGYGLGGRWSTKLGLVGIDLAFPFAGSWLQGKIHLTFQIGF